ncbi:MAG: Mur ligase family protein [Actinobacteria bacterium]|nr:Mur ligase family protein [Actinomycetota bacterium]
MKFTFERAVNFIDGLDKFGINPSLDNIKKLCNVLKDPQDKFPSIQVVGTNGKTSTARFIAMILCSLVGSFGTYISPHIQSYIERFLICEKEITEEKFARIAVVIDEVKSKLSEADSSMQVTQFEFLTAMAFKYFEQEGVDGAVLEAGMGGRWDATNAKDSRVVVFMPVALEHCEILGNTVEEIASEKAGVIKSGSDVVLMSTDSSVRNVVENKCSETSSRLFTFNSDFNLEKKQLYDGSYFVKFRSPLFREISFKEESDAGFQLENLLAATMASALFMETLPSRFDDAIRGVVGLLKIPGRFETVSSNPLVVLDGGHNPQAVSVLVNELDNLKIEGEKCVIFAAFNDKDVASMLVLLAKHADHFIFTSSRNKRSFAPRELERVYLELLARNRIKREIGYMVFDDIATSMQEVLRLTSPEDAVIVTGSISNIGPAKEYLCSARSAQR